MSLNQNKHQLQQQQQQQQQHLRLQQQHHQYQQQQQHHQQQQQWQQHMQRVYAHQQQLQQHHHHHQQQQQYSQHHQHIQHMQQQQQQQHMQHHHQLQQRQHHLHEQQQQQQQQHQLHDMAHMNMFNRGASIGGATRTGNSIGCLYDNNTNSSSGRKVGSSSSNSNANNSSTFDLDMTRHTAAGAGAGIGHVGAHTSAVGGGGGGGGYIPATPSTHGPTAASSSIHGGYVAGSSASANAGGNRGTTFSQNSMLPPQNIKTEPLEQLLTPTIEMEELIIKTEPSDDAYTKPSNYADETAPSGSNAYPSMNYDARFSAQQTAALLQPKLEHIKQEDMSSNSLQKPLNFPRRKLQTERSDTLPICQRCKQVFFKKHSYTKHITLSICNIVEYDFKCPICPMSFMSQEELHTHEQLHRANMYFCHKYCGKYFDTIELCEVHEYMQHDYTSFVCNLCTATFSTRDLLYAHLPQHRNQPRFDCPVCRVWFTTPMELHQHRLAASQYCGKYYKANAQTDRTYRNMSTQPPNYNLQDCRMGVMEVPNANNFNPYLHNRPYAPYMPESSSNNQDFHMPTIKTEIKIEHDIFGTSDYNLPPPQPAVPPPSALPATPTTPTQRNLHDFINKSFGSGQHTLSFNNTSDFLDIHNSNSASTSNSSSFNMPPSPTTPTQRNRVVETINDDAICCVPKCGVRKSTSSTLQFFTFPKDEKYLHQWLHNLKMLPEPQTNYANYRICSLHFPKRCINRYSLCYWAVPTFNLGHDDVANLYQNREITNLFTSGENAQCSMPGCHSQRGESNCKFYNFPNDMKTRIKWCQNARLPFNSKEPRHFCSRHFEDRCFGKFRLKPWAVPTLHLGTPYGKIHDNPGVFYLEEKKCCLVHCRRTRSSDFNLSLYRFPRDEVLLQRWCYNLRLDPAIYRGKNHKICSAHFIKEALGLRKLTPGAVPTLNLGHSDTFNIYENELPTPPPPPPPSSSSKMYNFNMSPLPTPSKYGSHSSFKFSIASITSSTSSLTNNYDSVDVCFVPSCKRNRHKDGVTLHTIPRRPEQMQKWCHNLKLDIEKLHKGVRICSAHFESYCIGGCMRPFAVPTLNLGHDDPDIYKNPDVIKKLNIRETCCVPLCKRNRDRDHANLHRFPANMELLTKWCENLHKPIPDGTKLFNDAICEVHFEDRCLRNKRLEKWAIPTVNLGHEEELKHKLPTEEEIAEFWSKPSAPNTGDEEGECCVETCRRDPKVDDIKLYRTPDDPEVLAKWAHNLQLEPTELMSLRICNLHFESHCIGKRLHSWAIPTLNLAHNVENLYENPEHLHVLKRERRASRASNEPVKPWMPRCCLPHCRKMRNIDHVQLFRFPILNRGMLAKWCHNLQLPLVGNAHRRICSTHFEPHVLTKRCPMPQSVPTLDLNTPPGYKIYQNPARLKLAKLRLERVCIVSSCRRTRTDGVQLFRFPHNRMLLRKWSHNTRQKPADAVRAQYRVCSRHFEPHSFGARRLSPGAIPTLNLDAEVVDIYPNEAQSFAETQCVVPGCESGKDMERVRLFKFPCDDEDLLWKWCNNLKMNPVDCKGVRICSRHFEQECVGTKMLYKWAIPTVDLGHKDAEIELVPIPKPEERYNEVIYRCCIPTCGKTRKYDDAQMNSFPKNLRLFRCWKHNLKLDFLDFKEREKYKICNDHFEPVCLGKLRLNYGAIPTINLGHNEVDDLYEVEPEQLQVSLFGKVRPLFERGASKQDTEGGEAEVKCVYPDCKATRTLLRELYELPKEEELLSLWFKEIGLKKEKVTADSKMCGLHYMDVYQASLEQAKTLEQETLKEALEELTKTFERCQKSLPVLSAQCCIPKCETNQFSKEHKLYPFPYDTELAAKWRFNVNLTQEEQRSYSHKVCARHFEAQCFTKAQCLRPWAVPTLELQNDIIELKQNPQPGSVERPHSLQCCVPHCGREKSDDDIVKLFPFPTDDSLRQKWLHNIQMQLESTAQYRICDQHFEQRCIFSGRLMSWAMPTLNLGHSDKVTIEIHESAPPTASATAPVDELLAVPHVKIKRSLDTLKCCVPSCRRSRLEHGVRLFEFPDSRVMMKQWCHNLQLSMKNLSKDQLRICHLHFHKRCIDGKQLKPWAKPTQHLRHTRRLFENPQPTKSDESVAKCCMVHCQESDPKDKAIHTFEFPKDAELQRKWNANLRLEAQSKKSLFLCSAHFPPEVIANRKLRSGAVPTLNLGHDEPLEFDNEGLIKKEETEEEKEMSEKSFEGIEEEDAYASEHEVDKLAELNEVASGGEDNDDDDDDEDETDQDTDASSDDEEAEEDYDDEETELMAIEEAATDDGDNDDSKDAEIDDDDVEMLADENTINSNMACDPLDFVECVQGQNEAADDANTNPFDNGLNEANNVCCLAHCESENSLITFGFPREPELLQKWCDNLKLRPKDCTGRLCISHFETEMLNNKRLRPGAVPTLNLGHDEPIKHNILVQLEDPSNGDDDSNMESSNTETTRSTAHTSASTSSTSVPQYVEKLSQSVFRLCCLKHCRRKKMPPDLLNTGQAPNHIRTYRFPLNPELRRKWCENLRLRPETIQQARICEMHFEQSVKGSMKLIMGAVPTLDLGHNKPPKHRNGKHAKNSIATEDMDEESIKIEEEESAGEAEITEHVEGVVDEQEPADDTLRSVARLLRCCVAGCGNTREEHNVRLFRLPNNHKTRKMWLHNLNLAESGMKIPYKMRVCAAHFDRQALIDGYPYSWAMPTLKLGHTRKIYENPAKYVRDWEQEKCCLKHCNSSNKQLFEFPKRGNFLRKWAYHTQQDPYLAQKRHYKLCGAHFESNCFEVNGELKESAVPTLQLGANSLIDVELDHGELVQDSPNRCCAVKNCGRSSLVNGVKCFNFPTDRESLAKWCHNLQLKEEDTNNAFICNMHFEKHCVNKRALETWAVPTLLLGHNNTQLALYHNPARIANTSCHVQCCVSGCGRSTQNEAITLHSFPKSAVQLKAWIHNLKLSPSGDLEKNFKVCSLHFESYCITDKQRLRIGAIPTLLLGHSDSNIYHNNGVLQACRRSVDSAEDKQPVKCAVPECGVTANAEIKFHKLPADEKTRQQWNEYLQLKADQRESDRLCGEHYKDACKHLTERTETPDNILACEELNNNEADSTIATPLPALACSIPGCSTKSTDNIALFEFPRNSEVCAKWQQNTKVQFDVAQTVAYSVCALHFEARCFTYKRLQSWALPTLKLGHTDDIKQNPTAEELTALPALPEERCCLPHCMRQAHVAAGIELYAFPSHAAMFQKWVYNLRMEAAACRQARLCNSHFKRYCFVANSLLPWAVPTQQLGHDNNLHIFQNPKIRLRPRRNRCCLPHCGRGPATDHVDLHAFPANEQVQAKWWRNLQVPAHDTTDLFICRRHFERCCFAMGSGQLYPWALPTLDLGHDFVIIENPGFENEQNMHKPHNKLLELEVEDSNHTSGSTMTELKLEMYSPALTSEMSSPALTPNSTTRSKHNRAKSTPPPTKCSLPSCGRTTDKDQVRLFPFPKEDWILEKWCANTRISPYDAYSAHICSAHFEAAAIGRTNCRPGAVPTLELGYSDLPYTNPDSLLSPGEAKFIPNEQCAISSCRKMKRAGAHLYKYPNNPQLLAKWAQNCKHHPTEAVRCGFRICRAHFEPECFDCDELRVGAIPTLQLGHDDADVHHSEFQETLERQCCVKNCAHTSREQSVLFFKPPRDRKTLQKWCENLQLSLEGIKNARICSAHFEEHCLKEGCLRMNAVPTLLVGHANTASLWQNPSCFEAPQEIIHCCVSGCGKSKQEHGVQLSSFPKSDKLFAKWAHNLKLPALDDVRLHYKVCSVHFEKFCYHSFGFLKMGAIPTLNLGHDDANIFTIDEQQLSMHRHKKPVKKLPNLSETAAAHQPCAYAGCINGRYAFNLPKAAVLREKWRDCLEKIKAQVIKDAEEERENPTCDTLCALHFKAIFDENSAALEELERNLLNNANEDWAECVKLLKADYNAVLNFKFVQKTMCCVLDCKTNNLNGHGLFMFPYNRELQAKWCHNLKTTFEEYERNYKRVCALHFEPLCFKPNTLRIHVWAVPTLQLPTEDLVHIYRNPTPDKANVEPDPHALEYSNDVETIDGTNASEAEHLTIENSDSLMYSNMSNDHTNMESTSLSVPFTESFSSLIKHEQIKFNFEQPAMHSMHYSHFSADFKSSMQQRLNTRHCRVYGCTGHAGQPGIIMHKFPLSADRLHKWEHNTQVTVDRRCPWRYRVCSRHFEPFCLEAHRLPYGANPTLNLGPRRPADIYENDFSMAHFNDNSKRMTTEVQELPNSSYEVTEYNGQNAASGIAPNVSISGRGFKCCVPMCELSKGAKTRLFEFPMKQQILNRWLRALNIGYNALRMREYRICEWHFPPSDVQNGRLCETAVPSLNLDSVMNDNAIFETNSMQQAEESMPLTVQIDEFGFNEIRSGARKCCLMHCQKHMLKDNVKIHTFPRSSELQEKWAHNLNIKYDDTHPWRFLICSAHFEPQCIKGEQQRLYRWAVPTLHLGPNPPAILFTNDYGQANRMVKQEESKSNSSFAREPSMLALEPDIDINETYGSTNNEDNEEDMSLLQPAREQPAVHFDQQSLGQSENSLFEVIYEEQMNSAPNRLTSSTQLTDLRHAKQRTCCLSHCRRVRCATVKLFRAPRDPLLRKKWEHNFRVEFSEKLFNVQLVCSEHFEPHLVGPRKLIQDAIPTLNLGHNETDIYPVQRKHVFESPYKYNQQIQPQGLPQYSKPANNLHCHVPGCQRSGLQLFKFPINEVYCNIWLQRTQIAYDIRRRGELRVCAAHFEYDCLEGAKLNHNAVPTLYLPAPEQGEVLELPSTSGVKKEKPTGITCSVPYCHNSTTTPNIVMFSKFPDDFELFTKWCFNLKIDPRKYTDGNYHVCSGHFEPCCVVGQTLRKWAVPTLRLGHSSNEIHYVEQPPETETQCALPHCGRRQNRDGVEFFDFPKGELSKIWCQILQVDEQIYGDSTKKICSAHFTPDCFGSDAKLRTDARPSMYLGTKAMQAAAHAHQPLPYRCKCIVRTCYEMKQLFNFPEKRDLCVKWCHNLKVDYHPHLYQNRNFKICHKHFEAHCVQGGRLQATAIPTLQLGHNDVNIYKNMMSAFGGANSTSTPSYDENSSLRTSVSTLYAPIIDVEAGGEVNVKEEILEEGEHEVLNPQGNYMYGNMNSEGETRAFYGDFEQQNMMPHSTLIGDEMINAETPNESERQNTQNWQTNDEEAELLFPLN